MLVPMKRAHIVCLKEDRENLLRAFQKSEKIMLISPNDEKQNKNDVDINDDCKKTTSILKQIRSFEKKSGILPNRPEITYDELFTIDNSSIDLESQFSQNILRLNNIKSVIASNNSAVDKLLPWLELETKVENLSSSNYTKIFTGFVSLKNKENLKCELNKIGIEPNMLKEINRLVSTVIVCYVDDEDAVLDILKRNDFTECTIPVKSGTVKDEYLRLKKQDEYLAKQLIEQENKLRKLSEQSYKLKILLDKFLTKSKRDCVQFNETSQTVFFDGWVRSDQVDDIAKIAKDENIACDIEFTDPKENETPPSATKNNKFTKQFEIITDMFSAPSYGKTDPNPIMAPWYWIIFGLMVGDAGYGFLMLLICFLFKKLFKPRGGTQKITNIIMLSSATTMFWGIMFGSYFGVSWNPIMFSPIDNPVSLLIFSLVLGILHIFSGMLIKAYEEIKSGHVLDAIFDQFSWISLITGLCLLFLQQTRTVGIILAVVGAAIVLLTGGRKSEKAIGKVTGGLSDLYGITAYLSDILSYSRILALGLATGVVAMVMNILAGMVGGSVVGIIFSLLIYIVGHLFNLVLSLLSAYVHDSRLQYIEFFNKFYDGGGEAFVPLSVDTEYVDIKK